MLEHDRKVLRAMLSAYPFLRAVILEDLRPCRQRWLTRRMPSGQGDSCATTAPFPYRGSSSQAQNGGRATATRVQQSGIGGVLRHQPHVVQRPREQYCVRRRDPQNAANNRIAQHVLHPTFARHRDRRLPELPCGGHSRYRGYDRHACATPRAKLSGERIDIGEGAALLRLRLRHSLAMG